MSETEHIHPQTFSNNHIIVIPPFLQVHTTIYFKQNKMSNNISSLKHLNANRKKPKSKCELHGHNAHNKSIVNFGKQTHYCMQTLRANKSISSGAELTIHEWRDKSQHTCKKNARKLKSTTIFSPKVEHN
jgi:hypothetical protein